MERTPESWIGLLFFAWVAQANGDAAQPVCVTSGQDATLSWQLLSRPLWHGVIVISLDNPQNIVFMASLVGNQLVHPILMSGYQDTVNVSNTLVNGYLQLSITNVTARHAGTYLCLKGLSEKDIIPNCGQTLNIIEAPQEARVTALGVAVEGNNFTLRCTASSASKPRDQHRPMMFRWFDSAEWDGRAVSGIPVDHLNASSAETLEGKPVAVGPADAVDEHPASCINFTSETITLQFTRKSDEGRQFACSASEGLGLWSEWSDHFTVHPQGPPSPEDLRLVPPDGVVELTSGGSVNLTCSTSTCRPACDITWEKVVSKKTSIPLQKGYTLTLKNVSLVEEGVYACAASNVHGRVSKTIIVRVVEGKKESPSSEPWISDHNRLAVILVVVSTIGLALGITGVAYIVHTWRRQRQRQQHPSRWRPRRMGSDVVPLSSMKRAWNVEDGAHPSPSAAFYFP